MPASEMPSSTVTVSTPMMRMSLVGSTIRELCSWGRGTVTNQETEFPQPTAAMSASRRSWRLIIGGAALMQVLIMSSAWAGGCRWAWGQEVQGRVLTCSRSRTVSAKPTVCMATATALAKAKMRPMEPPSSGPRLLEMRK